MTGRKRAWYDTCTCHTQYGAISPTTKNMAGEDGTGAFYGPVKREKAMRNILVFIMCLSMTAASASLRVTRQTCNMNDGLVVTDSSPKLGWQMECADGKDSQTAYQIQIVNNENNKNVVDTKKTVSSTSQLVAFDLPDGDYSWSVRVWGKDGKPSPWSRNGRFIVQNERRAFANAAWIGAITKADAKTPEGRMFTGKALKENIKRWDEADTLSRRSIYIAKDISLRKKVKSALMNICGLGFYELRINGEKVGDYEFAPTWSDYDRTVFYNTYDVTDIMNSGTARERMHMIEVLLGNGFYNEQGGRYHKLRISFGPPTLKMCLHIAYTDGTSENIVTDNTWRYSISELTLNSLYGGEDYDARIRRSWKPVVLQEGPKGMLRPQMAQPVKIMRRYAPVQCHVMTEAERKGAENIAKHVIPEGTFVLDMGQNLAGVPEIKVRGKAGQKVTIYLSETITPEGACNQRQTGRPYCHTYTLKGDGLETYRPRFSYYGYRYMQVEGAELSQHLIDSLGVKDMDSNTGKPVIEGIMSCFVHNSARKVSTFECSNPLINKTHEIIDMAVRSNMQSVFTDCPHREKLGWLEQDWLNGDALFMNYDLTGFAKQTVRNIADAQRPNGSIPTTAPEYVVFSGPGMDVFAESPEWAGTFIMMPMMYKQYYGDDSLLKEYYPQMVRYVDYLASVDSCGILKQGLGDWYDYGDFRSGFSRNTSVPLVSTAHYYRWVRTVGEIAAILGKKDDAAALQKRAEIIRKAWRKEFAKTLYDSQTGMAIALCLSLVDDNERSAVLDSLIADIQKHNNRLTTGDVGNRYLFEALTSSGRQDILYAMLNHYDVPGYGYQIKQGMTTLTGQWDPAHGSSMNHFMMGQIDSFHFTSLAGINIDGSHVTFRPQPAGDLEWCNASTETPYGKVTVSWKKDDKGKINLSYNIPVGMTAGVIMP